MALGVSSSVCVATQESEFAAATSLCNLSPVSEGVSSPSQCGRSGTQVRPDNRSSHFLCASRTVARQSLRLRNCRSIGVQQGVVLSIGFY